ncbi:MAG: ATP-binding protein [Paracoccaceae bacterium]
MTDSAYFMVNQQLARLLGETYRSSEVALKELVDNAWDADARNVWISLSGPLSKNPLTIKDDGRGMTEVAVRAEYLNIASDKRKRTGELSPIFKRKIKGRKGIGKFAGLAVAQVMTIETTVNGTTSKLMIDKKKIADADRDIEKIPLDFEVRAANGQGDGTLIGLSALDQQLNFPSAEKIRELLVREYGRELNFTICVDDDPLAIEDLPGASSRETVSLPNAGNVEVGFTIADAKVNPKSPGLTLKVGGKVVGPPSYFGLDDDEEIPRKLLKKVYGEISVPENDSFVTADWGSANESSKAYQEMCEFVQGIVKKELKANHARQMNLQKARLQKAIDDRLAKIPENRRKFAKSALNKILQRFYGESDDRIQTIAEVALDAMEFDEYWTVLENIGSASLGDVNDFAVSLQEFGLLELSNIRTQADKRIRFLDYLENLADNIATKEQEVHVALEKNLWVFGLDFSMMSSNITLKRMIKVFCDKKYSGNAAQKRPDLLLSQGFDGRYLLIEFKRPSVPIGRQEVAQAEEYRDELSSQLPSDAAFQIMMVGKGRGSRLSVDRLAQNISIHSYKDLISTARSQISWLINSLEK